MSMTALHEASDFEQARSRLTELANLPALAPAALTRRALLDKRFVAYLMLTRDSPGLQHALLNDPRTQDYAAESDAEAPATASGTGPPVARHTTVELLARASAGFLEWGKTGFRAVDEAQRERRWECCLTCPNLVDPPETLLYQGLRLLTGDGTKVCSACGCAANKKVGIPTEHCPVQDRDDPSLSRWGEPWHNEL